MAELIFVTSGKGGTGKTTVAAALSCAFAQMGKSVTAIDCDFGLGNLDIALGTSERVLFDLGDVLAGRVLPEQAVLAVEGFPGLRMIPASKDAFTYGDGAKLKSLIEKTAADGDVVILDGPAGLGDVTGVCAAAANRALVVTNPETAGLRDAGTAVRALRVWGVPDIRLVLNRVDKNRVKSGGCKTVDDAIDALNVRLAGLIREDGAAADAFTAEQPLLQTVTKAGSDVADLAGRLVGETPDIKKYRGYI